MRGKLINILVNKSNIQNNGNTQCMENVKYLINGPIFINLSQRTPVMNIITN